MRDLDGARADAATLPRPAVDAGVGAGDRVLLLGDDELASAAAAALESLAAPTTHLRAPSDAELRAELAASPSSVLVASRNDILALRYALLVEHLRPGVPLVVTIFDRTVADELRRNVENCDVISLANVAVPALAGPCIDPRYVLMRRQGDRLTALQRRARGGEAPPRDGWELVAVPPHDVSWPRRLWRRIGTQGRSLDGSARLLLVGLIGLASVLVLDTAVTVVARHEHVVDAVYTSVKTIATVGPDLHADTAPGWYKLFSSAMIVAALAFVAAFTAGLVNRLTTQRLTPIFGRHTAPRRDHVVVVGLGHVGLRLCSALLQAGVPVIAVEQNPDSPHLRLARSLRIPTVIGRGGDRYLLRRVGIARARALAAVTSEDVTNIAACVTARALAPDLRIVLRAGDGDVAEESQALFRLGTTCDVLRLAGAVLAAAATGSPAREAFLEAHRVTLVDPSGRVTPLSEREAAIT